MKKRSYILFALLVLIFCIVIIIPSKIERTQNTDFVHQLQSVMTESLVGIVITPYQLSPDNWEVAISEGEELKKFVESITRADIKTTSGHSGPIGEWTLTFQFKSGKRQRYLASVHKYEPDDLFLTDTFYIQKKSGTYSRDKLRTARLPDLGSWIIDKAPEGKLSE